MNITRNDFVFLPVTSFDRANAFYSGVLGLGTLLKDSHYLVRPTRNRDNATTRRSEA
jgi:catechol 2,3-dioxygenase-like lactoylglutathione lyase family enzyme